MKVPSTRFGFCSKLTILFDLNIFSFTFFPLICLSKSLDQDIKSCGSDILVSVLRVVVLCIDSPEKHFAEVFGNATLLQFVFFLLVLVTVSYIFTFYNWLAGNFARNCSTFLEGYFL